MTQFALGLGWLTAAAGLALANAHADECVALLRLIMFPFHP